jgi:hypothetical protein
MGGSVTKKEVEAEEGAGDDGGTKERAEMVEMWLAATLML